MARLPVLRGTLVTGIRRLMVRRPSHTYATAGTYTVSLVVTDDDGAASTVATESVTVDDPPPVSSLALMRSRGWFRPGLVLPMLVVPGRRRVRLRTIRWLMVLAPLR